MIRTMIRIMICQILMASLLLAACEKERAVPENPGSSKRQQQESPAQSYGIEASSRLLTAGELAKLSPYQLKIMKNGIYARHGYTFRSQDMIEYFEKQEWYEPDPGYSDNDLTAIEKQNMALITSAEKGGGAAGTSDDRKAFIRTWGTKLAETHAGALVETEHELFDIDGDRDQDAVAFYLHSVGGNSGAYYCHLAVFENRDGVYVHLADSPAGDAGQAILTEIVSASKGTITCKTAVWLADDPLCCASGTGTAVFRLTGNGLEQSQGDPLQGRADEWSGE